MTDVRCILRDAIKAAGGNALCNPDQEWGCDLDDQAPGDCLNLDECHIGKCMKPEPDSHEMFAYGPEYYQVI